jgi:hypothetical protein
MDSKKLMPLADAAHELGCSWARAWRLMLAGDLQGVRRGRNWLVNAESVTRLKLRDAEAERV